MCLAITQGQRRRGPISKGSSGGFRGLKRIGSGMIEPISAAYADCASIRAWCAGVVLGIDLGNFVFGHNMLKRCMYANQNP
jgi:hypothetical protein